MNVGGRLWPSIVVHAAGESESPLLHEVNPTPSTQGLEEI
jgi:hypothetical protein